MNREGEVFHNAPDLSAILPSMPCFEELEETFDGGGDLICLSHLRWDFVYQRPQHLMSRCARERRVFFIEEAVLTKDREPRLNSKVDQSGVCVVTPHINEAMNPDEVSCVLKDLIDAMYQKCRIRDAVLWYYTPMARSFTKHLPARATVYDCMDELSLFSGAPPSLKDAEHELLTRADVVFTGGVSLYEAKKHCHRNIHAIPSSIDATHFKKSRTVAAEPLNQQPIPHPRLGFAGVIDERFDVELLSCVAPEHPEWHFVMIGPVVKIDPTILPRAANIHYLGQRPYTELPAYFAGWDVALMPFARNDSTRYISPTKTLEYLAAGRPVVSTTIQDVVHPYGDLGLVRIADDPRDFAAAVAEAIGECANQEHTRERLCRVDDFLRDTSWDRTWMKMMTLLDAAIAERERPPTSLRIKAG